MIPFQKLVRTLRKSSLDDIAKKAGIKNDTLSKRELLDKIERLFEKPGSEKKFIHTNLFHIGFPILMLLIGFILGQVTDIPNTEVKADIIERNIIESVLNSEIENITLLLYLKKELKPDNYVYDGFLIKMRSSKRTEPESLEALFMVNKGGNKEKGQVWSLVCETFARKDYKSKIRTGYSQQPYESSLNIIPLPISLKNSKVKPFEIVRELDEWDIELFLPKEISKFVHKVRLVVNSGYQFKEYTTVFEKEIVESDWENTEYEINNNFELDMKMTHKYVKNIDGFLNEWEVDINKSSIDTLKNSLPDIFRVGY